MIIIGNLSAVWFLHIAGGVGDPFAPTLNRRYYLMQGVKRAKVEKARDRRIRLPINPRILRQLKVGKGWDKKASDSDTIMMWAVCCLRFFGFLRTREMTTPSDSVYDPASHLGRKEPQWTIQMSHRW